MAMINMSEAEDDDIEVVVLPPGQEAEAVDDGTTTISREELQQLRAAADDRLALRELTSNLNQTLRTTNQQPANVVMPAEMQTEEEFDREVEEQLLANGKTRKVIEKVIDKRLAPFLSHYEKQIAGVQRKLTAQDSSIGEVMKEYSDEFEAELNKLPAYQRTTAEAYEMVATKVRNNHFSDIVAKKVAEELAKREAADDGDDNDPAVARQIRKPGGESGRMSGGVTAKRKVVINDKIRAEAARLYMDVNEYARKIAAQ
jgi:hypothetical protein